MTHPRLYIDGRVRIDGATATALEARGVLDTIRKLCTHPNPELASWFRHRKGRRPNEFVSSAKKERGGAWSFPRGRLAQIIDAIGETEIVDSRVVIPAPLATWRGPPARDYQRRLIDAGLVAARERQWTAGVWRSPPASGKTNAALELVAGLGLRSLVIVPNTSIFKQWVERARALLGTEPGEIRGQTRHIGQIVTIGMQQTLWKCSADYADKFGAVIVDECQLCGSRTYQEVINNLPATYRLAVSGDEHRADGKEFLIYDQFGGLTGEVTEKEMLEAGGAVPIDVVIIPTTFAADWYKALPPDGKFLRRSELLAQLAADQTRNATIVNLTRQCVAQGERVIVLTHLVDHALRIDAAACVHAPSVLLTGTVSDEEFDSNKAEFASGAAQIAVGTYKAVGIGFESHRELARGILASPVASNPQGKMQFKQFCGRFSRSSPETGKRRAVLYYPLDVRVFGKKPAKLIAQWCGEEHVTVQVGDRRVPVKEWLKGSKHETTESTASDDDSGFFGFG